MHFDELHAKTCSGLVTIEGRACISPRLRSLGRSRDDISIGRSLGKGTYSNVYLAHNFSTGGAAKRVALKVFKNDRRYRRCGLREAGFLQRVAAASPDDRRLRVLAFYGAVRIRDHVALLLEVAETDLYQHQLSVFRAVQDGHAQVDQYPLEDLAVDLCSAAAALHRARVTHADIKPENVLLVVRNKRRFAVLADLGSARSNSSNPSEGFEVSPWYRAPEVYCRGEIGTPADMWSIACVIYEYAYGHPLFGVTRGSWASTNREATALYLGHERVLGPSPSDFVFDSLGSAPVLDASITLRDQDITALDHVCASLFTHQVLAELLLSCLVWRPTERAEPEQALAIAQRLGKEDLPPTAARAPVTL